jgi:hypothetical protein
MSVKMEKRSGEGDNHVNMRGTTIFQHGSWQPNFAVNW